MAGVDPIWADERGGSAFPGHGPVVGVPVVVLAAGSGEDLSEQQAEPFGAGPGRGSSGPAWPGAQAGELYRAVGDERLSGLAGGWVRDDARVDKG